MASTGHGSRRPAPVRERPLYVNENGAAALPRTAVGSRVILLGLEHVGDDAWDGLAERGIAALAVEDVAAAVQLLAERAAQVVIADAHLGPALIAAVRARRDAPRAHVIVCVEHDSAGRLRAALDAGADDVMRLPFEPEELVARVAAGLTAARLSANDALLRSLVANIPGALYRCACDEHWTMEWLSDQIEQISGYPASDFVGSAVRTFASVIHSEDREQVERSVMDGVRARRPFTLEYRIVRRDGGVRWVLERGQLQEAEDGRRWLDGAIFDITVRRAAEQALHEREIAEAQLAEVRASRARIVEAADRARREIERNLHDGAQQRLVAVALQLQVWLAAHRELSAAARHQLGGVLSELRAGLAELRDLAHGLHPAVLSESGLEHALAGLASGAGLPVELQIELRPQRLPTPIEAAAYFTVCEALTNVAKYAHATRAWVSVVGDTRHLDIEVKDNGLGGAQLRAGSGLQGLRDRVAAVNGTLDIDSRPETGTVVRGRVPVAD